MRTLVSREGFYRRVYNAAKTNEASLLSQKGSCMKTIFNNKGRLTLYSLLAVAVLSFVVFLLFPILLHVNLPSFIGILALIAIIYVGGIVIQIRSGPPW
jgi:hypothetical protein